MTEKERKFLLKSQQGEMNAVLAYQALADKVKSPEEAAVFRQLAAEEGHHAAVLRGLTKQVLKPKKTMAFILTLLYTIIGRKRLFKIIAQGEYAAIEKYQTFAERFPEMESVKNDEKRHGDIVMGLLNTSSTK